MYVFLRVHVTFESEKIGIIYVARETWRQFAEIT